MSTSFQKGQETKIAVVFSCPGRHEEQAGHPAAKTTGKNLGKLLVMLEEKLGRDDLKRDKITIANAWNNVEYKAKTGRREATDKKIKEEENVQRLQEQLGGITDIVLFCGKKAQLISSKLTLTAKHILFIEHLGTLGLLSITKDVEGKPILSAKTQISSGCKTSKSSLQHENTRKRLEFIAHGLAESLEQAKG